MAISPYAQEPPITTITSGGYTDLASTLLGPGTYSYLFIASWAPGLRILERDSDASGHRRCIRHINADESDLFDYNDEIRDAGEAAFEENRMALHRRCRA